MGSKSDKRAFLLMFSRDLPRCRVVGERMGWRGFLYFNDFGGQDYFFQSLNKSSMMSMTTKAKIAPPVPFTMYPITVITNSNSIVFMAFSSDVAPLGASDGVNAVTEAGSVIALLHFGHAPLMPLCSGA